jgi:ketosteroid isomerase-like protein
MSRPRSRAGVLIVALVLPSLAVTASPVAAGSEEEVLAAEQARFEAMVRGDLAALGPMLSEDLVYTHSNGIAQSKSEFLEAIRAGHLKYETIDRQEARVRRYARVAVVTGRAAMRVVADGKPMAASMRFTDVYVERAGRWLLAAWQSTRIPDP